MYDRTILETIDYHRSMLADKVRMESYLRAILKAVKPGDVVLDIGSGTGILAYFACTAGAKRVYAVEQDPLIGLAETICRNNGFQDRVVFINQWSDQVELPEAVDLILTETIGNVGFEEGILGWVIDARNRLLAPNGRIVPQTLELVAVPTESHDAFDILDDWHDPIFTLDYTAVGQLILNNLVWSNLSPGSFLSQPASLLQADLRFVESDEIAGESLFTASRDGMVHGLGCWFRSTLVPGISISNGPPSETPSWTQIFLPLQQPLPVTVGDRLHVRIAAKGNGAHWHWAVEKEPGRMGIHGQTTLKGQFLQEEDRQRVLEMPLRSVDGEVDLAILEMMDGQTSMNEMAHRIKARFPWQFGRYEEALQHVDELTHFYGRQANKKDAGVLKSSNGHQPSFSPTTEE